MLKHFRDPCVHCGIGHDDVAPGPCLGDPAKAVPMAYTSLGVRWDHVEHFLIQYSNDVFEDYHAHISMNVPYNFLKDTRYVQHLKRPPLTTSGPTS